MPEVRREGARRKEGMNDIERFTLSSAKAYIHLHLHLCIRIRSTFNV